jgi:hypothetical protein
VKLIILIIIAIIALSYFGFDLRGIVEAPQTQENLSYVWGLLISLWENILRRPVLFFWQNIFIDLLWETFVSNFERLKAGESTDFELNVPSVEFN